MRRWLLSLLLACLLPAVAAPAGGFRTVQDLTTGWRFCKGDPPGAPVPGFDDSAWRGLDLPHDWSAEGPFEAGLGSGNGFAPGGVAWYRRRFTAPKGAWTRCQVDFDGVYDHAEVWLNGHFVGGRPYGYVPFRFDLTRWLRRDGGNLLAVRVDHSRQADSRWYTGSGIYRSVRLVCTGDLRLDPWDTVVTSALAGAAQARVTCRTRVRGPEGEACALEVEVLASDGALVARGSAQGQASEAGTDLELRDLAVPAPRLWTPDTPALYTLRARLRTPAGAADSIEIPFGIREARFEPDRGFLLNGAPLKLKGVCLHHDAGCLGAAVPDAVWRRRLRALKALGVNAIRTSHNPPSAAFLDLCDQLGFLVKEEAFDEFTPGKNKWVKGWNQGVPSRYGYSESFAEWSQRDVQDMVRRDRNHPCVILWSIGNELDYANDPFTHPALGTGYAPGQPRAEEMVALARPLAAAVRALDPTRPVTAALANLTQSEPAGFPDVLDAVGYNYQEARYEADHLRHPARIIYGSENGHSWQAWRAVVDHDFIAGQFLWTGIDYLGEAKAWPLRGSPVGLLDLCGFVKPEGWFRASLWSPTPVVQACASAGGPLEASWNWPAGPVKVAVYGNAEQVRLSLNGRDLGTRARSGAVDGVWTWDVPFEPGTLVAEGLRDGRVESRSVLRTAGPAAGIALLPEAPDGDIRHVVFEVRDAQGLRVPGARDLLRFEVEGPARLLGVGTGDLADPTPGAAAEHPAFQGRGLVILKVTGPGAVLKVSGLGSPVRLELP